MENSQLVRKKSQGGMLIFELANDIRDKVRISFDEMDTIYHCVDVYDQHLAKHTKTKLGKMEQIAKRRIKKLTREVRNVKCDIHKKRKALSDIIYIITNLESVKKWGSDSNERREYE